MQGQDTEMKDCWKNAKSKCESNVHCQSVLPCVSESWTFTQRIVDTLQIFNNKCLQHIVSTYQLEKNQQ